MFDFAFRIEIYVPKAKRQYGYYVLSLLDGDQLIGRVDPKLDRKTGILNINAVHRERGGPSKRVFDRKMKAQIESLAKFVGASSIDYLTETR